MSGENDNKLAQSVYLANMFAQKGTCNCTACKLLRNATEGMISQVLGGVNLGPGLNPQEILSQVTGGQGGQEVSAEEAQT